MHDHITDEVKNHKTKTIKYANENNLQNNVANINKYDGKDTNQYGNDNTENFNVNNGQRHEEILRISGKNLQTYKNKIMIKILDRAREKLWSKYKIRLLVKKVDKILEKYVKY